MPYKYIRFLILLAVIAGYFLLLRPLRGVVYHELYDPLIENGIQSHPELTITGGNSVSSYLVWVKGKTSHSILIKIPFGLFFLIAAIGLIWAKAKRMYYMALIEIQIIGAILSFLTLYLSLAYEIQFMIVTDLIVRYLIPLCSLGMVPLASLSNRESYKVIKTEVY